MQGKVGKAYSCSIFQPVVHLKFRLHHSRIKYPFVDRCPLRQHVTFQVLPFGDGIPGGGRSRVQQAPNGYTHVSAMEALTGFLPGPLTSESETGCILSLEVMCWPLELTSWACHAANHLSAGSLHPWSLSDHPPSQPIFTPGAPVPTHSISGP